MVYLCIGMLALPIVLWIILTVGKIGAEIVVSILNWLSKEERF